MCGALKVIIAFLNYLGLIDIYVRNQQCEESVQVLFACLFMYAQNIVATAVGFCYGLDLGSNTIAAVTRIGLMEMMGLCKALYPGT